MKPPGYNLSEKGTDMSSKKSTRNRRELRNLRIQQIIFVALGIIVILSMVLSLMY
jgi:hypothetical protein